MYNQIKNKYYADFINIINKQNAELLRLHKKITNLEKDQCKKYFQIVVLQELYNKYKIRLIEQKYKTLLKTHFVQSLKILLPASLRLNITRENINDVFILL